MQVSYLINLLKYELRKPFIHMLGTRSHFRVLRLGTCLWVIHHHMAPCDVFQVKCVELFAETFAKRMFTSDPPKLDMSVC